MKNQIAKQRPVRGKTGRGKIRVKLPPKTKRKSVMVMKKQKRCRGRKCGI